MITPSRNRYKNHLRHEGVWRAIGSEIIEHYLASGATF
jgi:hypothetical protein